MKQIYQKGFTLVELLIVTVILVVLAGAVLLAIDPTKKIKAAKDTTVKSDMGQLINALQAYYTNPNNGNMYPLTAVGLGGLIPNELKSLPQQQTGTAPCPTTPDGTTSNTNYCYVVDTTGKQAAVWGTLFSTGTAVWCWDSTSGAFRTEILATTIPTQASPICPLAAATPTPTVTITPTITQTPTFVLNVQKTSPQGSTITDAFPITSNDNYINCGSTCNYNYSSGSSIILTLTFNGPANPAGGYRYSWSGCDSNPQTNTCVLAMNSARTVTATFTPPFDVSRCDQYYLAPDNIAIFGGSLWDAQIFTPTSSHTIMKAELQICTYLSSVQVIAGIRAVDTNGYPTGNDLCSGTVTLSTDIPTSSCNNSAWYSSWQEIPLGTGCPVTANTKYAIVFRAPTAGSFGDMQVRMDVSSEYSRGYASWTNGPWYKDTGRSYPFGECW